MEKLENRLTSREVAEMMEIKHDNLLKKIDGINEDFRESTIAFSEYWTKATYNIEGNYRSYKEYIITIIGVKCLIDRTRKTPKLKRLINWYNENVENKSNIVILSSRFEESFINNIAQTFAAMGIEYETQKQILKYKIDLYIPKYNIAVEYDEAQHNISTNSNLDKEREENIKKELNCIFVRCDYKNSDAYNTGLVINQIIQKEVK